MDWLVDAEGRDAGLEEVRRGEGSVWVSHAVAAWGFAFFR
jgi:hypothetical protein